MYIYGCLCFSENYPQSVPEVSFTGISTDCSPQVHQILKMAAEGCKGEPMLFSMTSAVSDWLQSNRYSEGDKCMNERSDSAEKNRDLDDKSVANKDNSKQAENVPSKAKKPMRTANDVINRIRWDDNLDERDFVVAYLDRFDGVLEGSFPSFDWDDPMFPQHRIQFFKYKDEVVWDKRGPLFDNVFGSRGEGLNIEDVISRYGGGQAIEASQDNDTEFLEGEESASETDSNSGQQHQRHNNATRPNHFVCIQITNPEIISRIGELQEIFASGQGMSEGILPVGLLHITLCMLRISTEEAKEKAMEVMKNALPDLVSALSSQSKIVLEGLGTFRDRLVYAKIKEHAGITWLARILEKKFQDAGISTPGNHGEFVAHSTIFKLTRPMARKLGVRYLDRGMTVPYHAKHFGMQQVENIVLCSADRNNLGEDGFYRRIYVLKNCFLDLHPDLPDLVSERVLELNEQGMISDQDTEELNELLKNGNASLSTVLKYLHSRLPIISDASEKSDVQVLIARGLPGSGKSYLFSELSCHFQTEICSADSYFENDTYNYDPKSLALAHSHCFLQFIAAIQKHPQIIAVDNTNSRLWEYHVFVGLATILGYPVRIVEVICSGAATMKAFAVRNKHDVPYAALKGMYENWETDPSAILIPPALENVYLPEDPVEQVLNLCSDELKPRLHKPEIVYTALVLHQSSRVNLLRVHRPTLANLIADHVTIVFNPTEAHALSLPLGKTVKLKVVGIGDDGSVQAVAVKPMTKYSLDFQGIPHITISVADGIPPKAAKDLLAKNDGRHVHPCTHIELEAVVACLVDTTGKHGSLERIVDKEKLRELLQSPEMLESDKKPHAVVKERDEIKNLYIFDFDGTMFNTPDALDGKARYEAITGNPWPKRGFYGQSESLMPPVQVYPGPALADYRAHCNQPNSFTVILTGRSYKAESGVRYVLESNKIEPDRLILKDMGHSTCDYKVQAIKALLSEFPTITFVKLWEDLCENLTAFYELKKAHSNITWNVVDALSIPKPFFDVPGVIMPERNVKELGSALDGYLCSQGWLPDASWKHAAKAGVKLIAQCWGKAIGCTGSNRLALVFGSFPIGRKSDIDVCLLAPQAQNHASCMVALESELRSNGVAYIYSGHSVRCPRLKVRIEYLHAEPLEYDIVFCRVERKALTSGLQTLKELENAILPGDEVSRVAIGGLGFLESLQAISDNAKSSRQLAVVVEILSRILQANQMKGNAFHCPRTFHLTKLVGACLAESEGFDSPEDLLVKALEKACALKVKEWMNVFGQFVPDRFIAPMKAIFTRALELVSQPVFPSWTTMQDLLSGYQEYPPPNSWTVSIQCSCDDKVILWATAQFLEAKVGKCIRTIIDSGCNVFPGDVKIDRRGVVISLAVEKTEKCKEIIQDAMESLKCEVEIFDLHICVVYNIMGLS